MMIFAKQSVQSADQYVYGEQPSANSPQKYIKLNTNENPYPPSARVIAQIRKQITNPLTFQRYPNPNGEPLRTYLANQFQLPLEQVILSNGSDEILSLITRTFLEVNDIVASPEITYSLYKTLVSITGAKYISVPMQKDQSHSLQIDIEKLETSPAKVIFLSNPNAQTGDFIDCRILDGYIKNSDKLWVIDEAYNDFVDSKTPSFMSYLKNQYSNVIVVRTFSKSYSLAGMRIGYAVCSHPSLADSILKVKDSYNVDSLSAYAALEAVKDKKYHKQCISKIQNHKQFVFEKLQQHFSLKPLESQANFLLVYVNPKKNTVDAKQIYEKLKEQNILVRYFNEPNLKNYIRITIGSKEQNQKLLDAIKKINNI